MDPYYQAGRLIGIAMMVELGIAEPKLVARALRQIAEELINGNPR